MRNRWHVFLSYASEDRDEVALALYEHLTQKKLKVWIDAHELQVGDSLKEKIEHGLTHSWFGIVILSPNFFAKKWPQRELNALFALEERTKKKLLPVWHNIQFEDIARHSPLLAERVGIKTHTGFRNVCEGIVSAMRLEHRALAAALRKAEQQPIPNPRSQIAERTRTVSAWQYFPSTTKALGLSPSLLPCYIQPPRSKTPVSRIASGLAAMRYLVDHILRKQKTSNFMLVGINRGGSALATFLMERLNLSRDHLYVFDYLVNWEIPLAGGRPRLPAVELIILIDDIARTGRTINSVRTIFANEYPNAALYVVTLNAREEALAIVSQDEKKTSAIDYSPIVGYLAHDDLPWNVGASRDVFAYFKEQTILDAERRLNLD